MQPVRLLWHTREDDPYLENSKLIGCFSTDEAAAEAIETLAVRPGFRDHPNGFHVDLYEIDQINWKEGFGFDPDSEEEM
jgi:homoserine kinase type II